MSTGLRRAKDVGARTMGRLHAAVFRATDGRVLNRVLGTPVVMLTTTGRTSGRARTTMLTSPLQDGDRVVIVASYGGDDRDPGWYRNLAADPDVEIVMDGRRRRMRARTADPQERVDLWARITDAHGRFAHYQRRTEREIPVVILEP